MSRTALRNCVAVGDDGRFYACVGHKLIALHEENRNAQVLWEYSTGGQIPASPAIGSDGNIRVHSGDGTLHCVSHGGDAQWAPVEVGEPLGWASPVVDKDANTWICGYEGGLYRIDPAGGKKDRPFFRTRQKFDSTGLIYNDILFVGAEDGFVYAIHIDTSRGQDAWDHVADKGKTEWFINSSPALGPKQSIVVAGRDEYLYAFNLDGDTLWRLHIRGQLLASPVVAPEGHIYVGVSIVTRGVLDHGKLISVCGTSHRINWEYEARGAVESTPVIGDDGVIYFGDNAGMVHAVRPDGSRLWQTDAGQPVRSAGTIVPPGRVLFGLDDGTLVALACDSDGLAKGGWPKYMGSLAQSGAAG